MNSTQLSEEDLTLDYNAKKIISYIYVTAEIVKIIFLDDFLKMNDEEIIANHLKSNVLNDNFIELKTQEVKTDSGKQTRFDLHFEVTTKDGRTHIIILEIQRQRKDDVIIRAVLYPSKVIAEQMHKEYKDFNNVISSWINVKPRKEDQNTIISSEFVDSKLEFIGDEVKKTLILDKPSSCDLMKIIQINVGGPKDPNFHGIFKLLYNLFNNNPDEVQKYYENQGIQINLEEVLNPMMEYTTLDDQVRQEAFEDGEHYNSLKVAKNMLKKNFSFDEILELVPDLNYDQLKALKAQIIEFSI